MKTEEKLNFRKKKKHENENYNSKLKTSQSLIAFKNTSREATLPKTKRVS